MEQKIVKKWLEAVGAKSDGAEYTIERSKEVTLLIAINEDLIPIVRVDKVTFHDDFVEIQGERERLFAPQGSIAALKTGTDGSTSDTRTGFH